MAFVGIVVPTPPAPPTWAPRRATTLVSTAGVTTLDVTSPEVNHANLERDWRQVPRPGNLPFLRDAGPKLRTWRVTAKLYRDLVDVAGELDVIVAGHAQAQQVTVTYGRLEAIPAVISSLAVRIVERIPGTNEPRWVDLDIEFTEKPAELRQVAPAVAPSAAPPPPSPASSPSSPKAATYTVKKGDTLFVIAQRTLGNGSRWPAIADLNHVRDPKAIKVGQVLHLP